MAWVNDGIHRKDDAAGHRWTVIQPSGAKFSTNNADVNVYLEGAICDPLIAVYHDIANTGGSPAHPLNGRLGEYVSITQASLAPTAGAGTVESLEGVQRGFVTSIVDTNGKRVAWWDARTGHAFANGADLGTYADWAAALIAITEAIGDIGEWSPAHARGIGPITDKNGDVWLVDPLNHTLSKNGTPTTAWTYLILWEPDHASGAGRVYHRGPYTKNWMYPGAGPDDWPEYDPNGRDPETNALPPADSPNDTFGTTVTFWGSVWTRGAASGADFFVMRDGVPFRTEVCENLLVYGGTLYWVTDSGDWWQFIPGAHVGYHGTVDPRTPPSTGDGPFFDWQTTANITQGSNIISGIPSAEYDTLQVGMWLIALAPSSLTRGVLRTDKGPGGSYPARGVANTGALGSGSFPEVKYLTSNGEVYQCDGGSSWTRMLDRDRSNRYIYSLVLARSYHARIRTLLGGGSVEVEDASGNPLACQRSVTGASVVVNNIPIAQAQIDALAGGATGYELPNMLLPGAGVLYINRNNFELTAAAETAGFWTPRGVAYAGVQWNPNKTGGAMTSMTWKGNYSTNNHSMNWREGPSAGLWPNAGGANPVTDFVIPQGNFHGSCATFLQGASGAQVTNVWFHDYPNALGSNFCDNNWYDDVHVRLAAPQMDYTGWMISHNDTVGGGCRGADIVSTYAMKALEAFKARTCEYSGNVVVNGVMACNNSQMEMLDNTFTWTTNSHVPDSYQSPHDAIIQISKNISGGFADLGVTVDGATSTQNGYVYKGCATKLGIEVNTADIAIMPTITNVTFSAPDAVSTAGATVDNGTSSSQYGSGARALNVAHSRIGNVSVSGLSPHHFNWSGAWQFAAIRGTNGSTTIGGTTRTTACTGHGHGADDIDLW